MHFRAELAKVTNVFGDENSATKQNQKQLQLRDVLCKTP
jgi:hypothetical protein